MMITAIDYLEVIKNRILSNYKPLAIILFGSHARNEARPDSDLDILVVFDEIENQKVLSRSLRKLLSDLPVAKDIMVVSVEDIKHYGNMIGHTIQTALKEGEIVYNTISLQQIEDEMSQEDINREVKHWLKYAEEDLQLADSGFHSGLAPARIACLHAQQSAEKTIKAALVFLQIEFPRTHKLNILRNLLPSDWRIHSLHPDLERLSDFAVESRYPGDWEEPTAKDAEEAISTAKSICDSIMNDLNQRGFPTA